MTVPPFTHILQYEAFLPANTINMIGINIKGILMRSVLICVLGSWPIQAQVDVASPGRLKLIEQSLLKGWTANVEKRGEVRPHGLAKGPGVHLRAVADPKIYPAVRQWYWGGYTIHLWLMAPDYTPGRFAKEDLAATATHLGRTDQFRAFYFVEKGKRTPGGAVGGHLAQGLGLSLEENFHRITQALENGGLEEKKAAFDELFLFWVHNFENDASIYNAMIDCNRSILGEVLHDPAPELLRHIEGLLDEAAFLAVLPRIQIDREVSGGFFLKAIRNRPDLTELLYNYCLERLTDSSSSLNTDQRRLLRLMVPPSEETLHAALTVRQTEEMNWVNYRGYLEAAVHHAAQSDYWSLAYELAPFSFFIMPETRKAVEAFFQRAAPHEAAAVGVFRALKDEWRGGMGFGAMSGLYGLRSMRYDMGQRSVAEWIKEAWPGKGKLEFFSSFKQSAELKQLLLKHLRERDNTQLKLLGPSDPAELGGSVAVVEYNGVVAAAAAARHQLAPT